MQGQLTPSLGEGWGQRGGGRGVGAEGWGQRGGGRSKERVSEREVKGGGSGREILCKDIGERRGVDEREEERERYKERHIDREREK